MCAIQAYTPGVRAVETSPMKSVIQVCLTILALVGFFCALDQTVFDQNVAASSSVRSQKTVLIADGSDPMPLCRAKHCRDKN